MERKQGSRWWKSRRWQPPPLLDAELRAASAAGNLGFSRAALEPLIEGPDPSGDDVGSGGRTGWVRWVRGQLSRAPSVSLSAVGGGASAASRSDVGLLVGVMGTPLAPFNVTFGDLMPHLTIKDIPIETSSAQYILHHYMGAAILQQKTSGPGGLKLQSSVRNSYTMGKIKMVASEFETATKVVKSRNSSRDAVPGSFVLWQMSPDKWYVELAVGGVKVLAGCNGELIWRHTPWLGTHSTKGPVRPLRRILQGLDPFAIARMFANAQCIGERIVNDENCFVLKIGADPSALEARSEGPVEIIRHFIFGYFSQKTGLLVRIEDSHLTRVQSMVGGDIDYWETTMDSYLDDYRSVDGIMIAHSGHSIANLFKFSELAMSHTRTTLEEQWTIEEVAFDVHGLSMDCFIPPADVKPKSVIEVSELPQTERGKNPGGSFRARVAALDKPFYDDVADDHSIV